MHLHSASDGRSYARPYMSVIKEAEVSPTARKDPTDKDLFTNENSSGDFCPASVEEQATY